MTQQIYSKKNENICLHKNAFIAALFITTQNIHQLMNDEQNVDYPDNGDHSVIKRNEATTQMKLENIMLSEKSNTQAGCCGTHPSYSGGRDGEGCGSRPAREKSS
jgi:hypothetical protein